MNKNATYDEQSIGMGGVSMKFVQQDINIYLQYGRHFVLSMTHSLPYLI
jgi:hypothetical protein